MNERLSHPERKSRRAQIAAAVKREKLTAAEASERFGVSIHTVWSACREHDVIPEMFQNRMPSAYCILARLLKGESQADIARDLGISRQAVNQVKQRAIEAGIEIPRKRKQTKD